MWKFIDAFPGGDYGFKSRCTSIGPRPVKVWVASKTDKRHKLSYKPRPAYVGNAPRSDEGTTGQVVQYAKWLARRDAIVIPSGAIPHVVYHVFPSVYDRTTKGRPVTIKHAMAVIWRIGKEDVAQIPIPHCGWEPAPAREERDSSFFDDLTPEHACRLIDIASPLSAKERATYDAMSTDQLLEELLA